MRGLKLKILLVDLPLFDAAPFVGAWIEIPTYTVMSPVKPVPHPSWVRGLKLKILLVDLPLFGRTLRGCVD